MNGSIKPNSSMAFRHVWHVLTVSILAIAGSEILPVQASGMNQSEVATLAAPEWDCAWLKQYVEESSIAGSFPLGPSQVTWAAASPPNVPAVHKELHRVFVADVIDGLKLPVARSDEKNSQLFIFFHTKKESSADSQAVLSELRSSERMAEQYPENVSWFEFLSFNACSSAYRLGPSNEVGRLTVRVPFERATGRPVEGVERCISERLMKAFGLSLKDNGVGRVGWTENCPRCVDVDRRMALILAENNQSKREQITVEAMLSRLSGGACQ